MGDVAAVYIRLSKEDRDKADAESESILNQRLILTNHAKSRGWSIYDYYVDEDRSGSDRARPEFNRLIRDAQDKKFNIVLVKTQSRFARDSKYIEDYIHEMFRDKGIRFVSLLDNIDTYEQGSRLNSRVHAIFDEEQLDLLSSNIKRSFKEKAKQGQFFGSMPPYGYKKDPNDKNRLIPDDEAAKVVRMIFEMTADGSTYLSIAKRLSDGGYPIPSVYKRLCGYKVDGMYECETSMGLWTRDMVRKILSNEVYRGTIVNHKSTVVNFRTKKKRSVPKSMRVSVPNMHEALIDDELWGKVKSIKDARKKAGSGFGEKHPLSGLVFCGVCGARMYKCKSSGTEYFRCHRAAETGDCENNRRIRLDELERLIIEQLRNVIKLYTDSGEIKKKIINAEKSARLFECEDRRAILKKTLSEKTTSLKRLLKGYTDGVIAREIYEAAQSDYLEEKARAEAMLAAAEAELGRTAEESGGDEIISRYTEETALTVPIAHAFFERITIGAYDISGKSRDIVIDMAF